MKTLTGIVVSNKMKNTVVVSIENQWQHPLYQKTLKRTKKYQVHTTATHNVGDTVTIVETKPMSRHKKWRVNTDKN